MKFGLEGRLAVGGEVALFDHFHKIFFLEAPEKADKTRKNAVKFVEWAGFGRAISGTSKR